MEHNISVKRILINILSIKFQVFDKFKNDPKYKSILSFLMRKDYYNDEDLAYPTLRDIEHETSLKTHQIRKQLKNIYYEMFDCTSNHRLKFQEVDVLFNLKYFKNYASFKCSKLNFIPRIGENITIPFLEAKVGTSCFYVERITHFFEGRKQTIDIELKGGFFNSYWYYQKHKALELGLIGIGEQYYLQEFELKKRLGLKI